MHSVCVFKAGFDMDSGERRTVILYLSCALSTISCYNIPEAHMNQTQQ